MKLTLLQLHPLHKLIKKAHQRHLQSAQEDKWASKQSTTKLSRIAMDPHSKLLVSIRGTKIQSHVLDLGGGSIVGQCGRLIRKKTTHQQAMCKHPSSHSTSVHLNSHQARVIATLRSEGLEGSVGKSFKLPRNVQVPTVLRRNRRLLDYRLHERWLWISKRPGIVSASFSLPSKTFSSCLNRRMNERSTYDTRWVFLLSMCFHSQSSGNLIS